MLIYSRKTKLSLSIKREEKIIIVIIKLINIINIFINEVP